VLYPTLEEYKKANERLIRDEENCAHDDEDKKESFRRVFGYS
jgi:hypothetical protein